MCGIAGLLNLNGEPLEYPQVVVKMAAQLVHRGPDDDGYLEDGPVAFGFRRLSIIDLQTGNQPISNEDDSIWVIFNGEIYNYLELRQTLEARGHRLRTSSDSEVIVHAYESFGLNFVDHLRGMFAIALWDSNCRKLILARDRVGKKPLFYGVQKGQLAFASEIKAFLEWPLLIKEINAKALHDYLTFLYVPSPNCIFADVKKLQPAHILIANCDSQNIQIQRYWTISPTPERQYSSKYYQDELRNRLTEAVRLRLRSDVPLGAFLSGGIDSSIIVGIMSGLIPSVSAFSIGFPDQRFDETLYAELVANKLGIDFTREEVNSSSLDPNELARLVWYMDEPFGDSSFIPTYWVSKAARKHVTVALSGDGGDELFAGYPRYNNFIKLQRLRLLPFLSRKAGVHIIQVWMKSISNYSPKMYEDLRQFSKALEISLLDPEDQILALITYYDETSKSMIYSDDWLSNLNGYQSRQRFHKDLRTPKITKDLLTSFMANDFTHNLVDDSLVKVDRASMACSLEVRSPFLDHHVVELAMRIPTEYKIRNQQNKYILKRAFQEHLPPEIMKRGKKGFEVPFAEWFQTKDWQNLLIDMISESRLRTQNIFSSITTIKLRDEFLRDPEARTLPISAYQLRHRVWMILMFQMWHEIFISRQQVFTP